ncbi:eEF1A lysine and N-terminal methyltransferase homolog [Tribolium castaneum]|uniref:eEF1A lysine and N-terminal methyltransferase homolog n=1 Tax=Tribolium castaneum TaxID=7070 RepID=D6WJR4_TRICA|nr:PREDICTED: methyltransferase-like protein 13 [Tribolium castaneum]EFA04484.1 Methyltransferase-like protein 13 [Tribolium castaneum]|eukprot:XP_001813626.1 PREDICTED: methyltransferase-like protein 13 [Tribolium castaneum]
MNLLPKLHQEFSQKEYWDTFFKKRGSKAFEWYGEYPELSGHLHKYIKKQDDILITGCGNSTLGRDLYDIGYNNVTNIDISQVVIRQMLSQNEKERPDLKYMQMDALDMSFQDDSFSVVLDKGTLDALMPDDNPETVAKIIKYFNEIHRVLKLTGRYICVSLLQDHILKILLDYFPSNNWMFRIVRCFEAEAKTSENGENSLPVFLVICTKFKTLPRKILELNLTSGDKMERFETTDDISRQIASVQEAAFVCSGLKKSSIEGGEVSLDLCQPGNPCPRFTLHVVETAPSARNSQYAAFIVPQGREAEWLFSTKSGRQHLAKITKTNRLAIVTMHRGHTYGNFEQVQSELGGAVCSLAPSDLKNPKIAYLSLGADVGARTVKHEGTSQFSGPYVVEDVTVDQNKFRRLFYLSSQLVIQSEAKLKTIKTRKGPKEIVDLAHLTCKHHIYMSVATSLACRDKVKGSVVVVGLGGGGLCSFLGKFLPQIRVTAVDIDPEMLEVATKWFGLSQNERLQVVIQDGVKYLEEIAETKQKFEAVLFDVDSKDTAIGLSCPPKQFLEEGVLKNVAEVISDSGFFILNLVLREATLRPAIVETLSGKFQIVVSYRLAEDLNEIFVCANVKLNKDTLKQKLGDASRDINNFFKKHHSNYDDFVEIEEYLSNLKIL